MDPFLIKLILSFFIGGAYIAFTLWLSEKFGSKVGGLITGLPSTILISLIFIAWTQDTKSAVAATPIIPITIAIGSLFLIALILLYRYGVLFAFTTATLLWFVLSSSLVYIHLNNMTLSIISALLILAIAIKFLSRFPHRKLDNTPTHPREFLVRTITAGSVVASAVFFGKILGPLWGGITATFPAALSTSMFFLSKKHGIDFAASSARSIIYGVISIVIFVTVFFYLVPIFGIIAGIMLSYIASLIYAAAFYYFVLKD